MRNLENHTGIKVGGQSINNLRYADDTVLIAENREDLQKLLNIVEEESRKKGLELNSKKTEVMVISRKQESPKCDIFIKKVKLKQTEEEEEEEDDFLTTFFGVRNSANQLVNPIRKNQLLSFEPVKNAKDIEIVKSPVVILFCKAGILGFINGEHHERLFPVHL
ncbi:retrovirus-related pol polyprotein from type-1 retrotransposable element r2 [Plakobranchus ocellatus]|uniref:Retrovirus-related pol polyprotein from type-1 retrotransposable element r2 n=1 Tax=Plakobranchus ocellatus TaxID=259542 RepID=A0AAV3YTA8_9GAST|nr:retrovirus-related pol polyprotein from type-1 retrotransposable element r2 [Plakobranchus ocellatus]